MIFLIFIPSFIITSLYKFPLISKLIDLLKIELKNKENYNITLL